MNKVALHLFSWYARSGVDRKGGPDRDERKWIGKYVHFPGGS